MKILIIVLVAVSYSVTTSAEFCLPAAMVADKCCGSACPKEIFASFAGKFKAASDKLIGMVTKIPITTKLDEGMKKVVVDTISTTDALLKKGKSLRGAVTSLIPKSIRDSLSKIGAMGLKVASPITYLPIKIASGIFAQLSKDIDALNDGITDKSLREIWLEILHNLLSFALKITS